MSKPKKPLLSLGARGTIADTLTFQKRGGITIARRKPIPTDPESPAQLAWRQVYRDAVDAWHALSPAEKEAWRGVYPALTPFQCFMKSELLKWAPTPPPEEYTEEQTEWTQRFTLFVGNRIRAGQRLWIPNRKVTKLGFWLDRANDPTGNVTFEILRVSDDGVLCSKLWGVAGDLPDVITYEEVTFDTPTTIDEEVRAVVHFEGGGGINTIALYVKYDGVKEDELLTFMPVDTWTDQDIGDSTYRYKYYLP